MDVQIKRNCSERQRRDTNYLQERQAQRQGGTQSSNTVSVPPGHIHCSAPNYKGAFHCTWKRTESRPNAAVLLVKAQRWGRQKKINLSQSFEFRSRSGTWLTQGSPRIILWHVLLYQPHCLQSSHLENLSCELDADGSGVRCDDGSCPYKEEQHPISLIVYVHSFSRLEAYEKVFFMRDIGKSCWNMLQRLVNLSVMQMRCLLRIRGGIFISPPLFPSVSPCPWGCNNNNQLPLHFLTLIPLPRSPHSVRPEKVSDLRSSEGNVFSWSYPDSWEIPCSYFGLQFQVKVVNNGQSCDSEEHIKVINM